MSAPDHREPRNSSRLAVRRACARRRAREGRRGVALVMVLGALTLLTILLTEFQDETSAEFGSALSARDAIQAEYAAHSAVNLSRLLIAAEPTIRKSVAILFIAAKSGAPQIPVWDFADQVLGAFNDKVGGEMFQSLAGVNVEEGKNLGLGLPGVGFEVRIIDEDAKININSATRSALNQQRLAQQIRGLIGSPQYDPLFDNRDADGQYSDRATICSALMDWADSNTEVAPCDPNNPSGAQGGPEDSSYQLLKDPYQRKNAPYDSLEELRLVRGVGDDFWATFIEPDDNDPTKRTVTVWGKQQLNINTANAQTLAAVICGMAAMPLPRMCTDMTELAKFLSIVNLVRGMTAGAPLFGSPKAFVNALAGRGMFGEMLKAFGLEPVRFQSRDQTLKELSTESKVFSIYATGYVRVAKRETRVRIHAVVDFRAAPSAPQINAQTMAQLMGAMSGQPGEAAGAAGAGTPAQPANLPEGATADAIGGALVPDPGGRIIYYRID